jgi:hypothetical protein
MRIFFLIIFFGISLTGFSQKKEQPMPVNPAFKRFIFEPNQQIVLKPYDSLYFDIAYESGDYWVFKFDFKAQDVIAIADDEFSESIQFQIKPLKGNQFVLNEADFVAAKVIYSRSCFCRDSGPRLVQTGTITGKKLGRNKWLINIELEIEPRPGGKSDVFTKKIKGYFNPGKLIY